MSENGGSNLPEQPWLPLLGPMQRAWREMEITNGRNPDTSIEEHLRETGAWPPANNAGRGAPAERRTQAKPLGPFQ